MSEPTILTEMILPDQSNHYGTLFGGIGLSLMTRAAFVAASRHAQRKVVLASCKNASFDAPVPVGSLFVMQASVLETGRSSMQIRVTGQCERPEDGSRIPVSQARFTMVAVDDCGRPVPVAAISLSELEENA